MMAFAKSVNVVIDSAHMGNITSILRSSIAENKEFFRTLNECFYETGVGGSPLTL